MSGATSSHTGDLASRIYRDKELISRIIAESRDFLPLIAAVFVVQLLATPLALLAPIPLKLAVDSVIGDESLPAWLGSTLPGAWVESPGALLLCVALLQVAIVLFIEMRNIVAQVLATLTGEKLVLSLRSRLFGHAQRLSLLFHDMRGTSDTTYRVQYDAVAIKSVVLSALIPFISSVFMLASMIYVMSLISPSMAAVALSICPILFVAGFFYNHRMRPQYKSVKRLESSALKVVQEVLGSIRIVKSFGREETEQDRFVETSEKGLNARVRLAVAEGFFGAIINVTIAVGSALVLYFGVQSVRSGEMTTGNLLVVIAYLAQLYTPIRTISRLVQKLQSDLASSQRIFELLDHAPEVVERTDAEPFDRANGGIEFDHVAFEYEQGNALLDNVEFSVTAGTKLGVLGPTGAGKSTLIALLMRFFDPVSGSIRIDGRDVRDFRLQDLRRQFGIVLQDVVLFSTTIGENILYARPEATQNDVIKAAKAAGAHDFIMALPDGYETLVGERGMRMSGGERQRISLARAFLKDAPILILDEPTSSLDNRTEAIIMAAMSDLMKGRTVLMVAHRLTTLSDCDALLQIENGSVKFIQDRDSIRAMLSG